MYKDITGIILAGGKSSRMGENKALLTLGGQTIIERIVNIMNNIFSSVIVVTNTPEEYEFLSLPLYKDIFEYKGPLAGIHSGLIHSKTETNFVLSCDMPMITEKMIKYIVEYPTNKPITVCRAEGFVQQLAGKYSKSILQNVENALKDSEEEIRSFNQKKRKCKVHTLLEEVGAEIIESENLLIYEEHLFFNMNMRKDYELAVIYSNNA